MLSQKHKNDPFHDIFSLNIQLLIHLDPFPFSTAVLEFTLSYNEKSSRADITPKTFHWKLMTKPIFILIIQTQ